MEITMNLVKVALVFIGAILVGLTIPREHRMLLQSNSPTISSTEAMFIENPPPAKEDTSHQGLQIAWLMSFPNSGTSYTGRLIRVMTQTYTGSNYGTENLGIDNSSVPVFEDQPTGPFFVEPLSHKKHKYPIDYIFTKTHCGGRCERCGPSQYTETSYSFRHRCSSGKWAVTDAEKGTKKLMRGTYSSARVKKAVHLYRNPFDNVVSRFHLERKIGMSGQIALDYSNSVEGFRQFCTDLVDTAFKKEEQRASWLTPQLDEWTRGIPCRSDFFRYVEWHNNAYTVARDMDLDTYVLHYDWYATRFNETAMELLEFLHLDQAAEPPPFDTGKNYEYFYSEERAKMTKALQYMASPGVWKQISRYLV